MCRLRFGASLLFDAYSLGGKYVYSLCDDYDSPLDREHVHNEIYLQTHIAGLMYTVPASKVNDHTYVVGVVCTEQKGNMIDF